MFTIAGKKINNIMISDKKWVVIIYTDENGQSNTLKIEGEVFKKICSKTFLKTFKTNLSKLFESEV